MATFEAQINQLIRKIIYMFYDDDKIMIMEGIIRGENKPKTFEEIQGMIHLRKNNLEKGIGILKHQGLLHSVDILDRIGLDPHKKLSEKERKNRTKTYFAIDYKILFDSVRLRIELARQELHALCGKDDNITYECKNCHQKFKLLELVTETPDGELRCPDCDEGGELVEVDIDHQINRDKKRYQEFRELTQPLLDQINKLVRNKVFEDKWENRISISKLMPEVQYNLKQRNKDEREQDRRMGFFSGGIEQAGLDKETTVHIKKAQEVKVIDEPTNQILTDMIKKKEEPKEDPEITLSGKTYKLSDVEKALENWEGSQEDFEKLSEFYEKYAQ